MTPLTFTHCIKRNLVLQQVNKFMSQAVSNSNTIANIQKSKAGRMSSAFRHQTLYEWIEQQNPGKAE